MPITWPNWQPPLTVVLWGGAVWSRVRELLGVGCAPNPRGGKICSHCPPGQSTFQAIPVLTPPQTVSAFWVGRARTPGIIPNPRPPLHLQHGSQGAHESQGAGEGPRPTVPPPDPNTILQRAGWAPRGWTMPLQQLEEGRGKRAVWSSGEPREVGTGAPRGDLNRPPGSLLASPYWVVHLAAPQVPSWHCT